MFFIWNINNRHGLVLIALGVLSCVTSLPYTHLEESVKKVFFGSVAQRVINSFVPKGTRLLSVKGQGNLPSLQSRLISNATSIREDIVDGFDCSDKVYGYYADQNNECQIFHVCVPMQQLFPDFFKETDVYMFSFICPHNTIFSQDVMVCAWEDYSLPCESAHHLYDLNQNFFAVAPENVFKTKQVLKVE